MTDNIDPSITPADIEHALNNSGRGCPKCGSVGTFKVTEKFAVRPLGSHSLAGQQFKFSAAKGIYVTCTQCGGEGRVAYAQEAPG